jgi:hypothetical protein
MHGRAGGIQRAAVVRFSGVISSTSQTIARRNFGSSIHTNAFTKSKPSDVARKSLTKEGEGTSADA